MDKLAAIANDMNYHARRTGAATRELSRGLRLQLSWVAGMKTLILSRAAVMPSEEEISICRHVFGVPLDAQRLDSEMSISLRWPS